MKKLFYLLFIAPILFSGCNNDNKGDVIWTAMATVDNSAQQGTLFVLDNDEVLKPTNLSIIAPTGQRALIQYALGDKEPAGTGYNYKAYMYDYMAVLTKNITDLTSENEAAIGNDPFYSITGLTIGGGYLNAFVRFRYDYAPNGINLVINKTSTTPAFDGQTVNLELRLKDNSTNIGYVVSSIACFDLSSIEKYANDNGYDKLTLKIKTNIEAIGEKTITLPYSVDGQSSGGISYSSDIFSGKDMLK